MFEESPFLGFLTSFPGFLSPFSPCSAKYQIVWFNISQTILSSSTNAMDIVLIGLFRKGFQKEKWYFRKPVVSTYFEGSFSTWNNIGVVPELFISTVLYVDSFALTAGKTMLDVSSVYLGRNVSLFGIKVCPVTKI